MKKKVVMLLITAMVASLAACGQTGEQGGSAAPGTEISQEASKEDTTVESSQETSKEESKEESSEASSEENNGAGEDQQGTAEGTLGKALLEDFLARAENGETADLQQLAEDLLANPGIDFMGGSMPMEEGYLSGFTKEITGFEECVMFSPMIGSIPFVGYVFNLADDADVDAFVNELKGNYDMRWNICTEASEMVVKSSGNSVFFVMCP